MSRAEDAVMRLYEDESLRAELTDEPANRLLRWAEDRLIALDESSPDDAAFAAGEAALREALRTMNQTVATSLNGEAVASAQAAPIDELALVDLLIAAHDAPAESHIPDSNLTDADPSDSQGASDLTEADFLTLDPDN